MSATAPASSDPAVYAAYQAKWSALPADGPGWIQRAKDVAAVLTADAAARERANKSPKAEVALLKHAGLLKVLGPAKYGGGAQPWDVAYRVVREVAKGDGSIGALLGYHLVWTVTATIFGSPAQADRIQKLIIANNYYVGGAVNPRDNDLTIRPAGDDRLVFNGVKNFSTGGVISDLTVLEGVVAGSTDHVFALVPTDQPGIRFQHNWDNVGLRLTESGGVQIQDVAISWEDALGWDAQTKKPDPSLLGVPLASIFLPLIQLNFANFYIGIAWGALAYAKEYTRKNTRPWPFGGDPKEKAEDEFYILQTYGNFFAHLRAATALADRANQEAARLYSKYVASGGDDRAAFTAAERGEFAEWVASAKVVATDTSLRVTAGVFEVTGARATAAKVGLDRFWRDVRTHTLHDPVAYKNREQGRYYLLDELPAPTWYT